MKLFEREGFPNPARIRIVLAEKRLESSVEYISVDLIGAEHKGAAFLAKNPLGVLPVLQLDDGTYISESTAITLYLDNLDGNPTLTGQTPKEKAVIQMMQSRAESELIEAVGDFFHYASPGLGAELEKFKSPSWTARQEWGGRQRDRALEGMKYFNEVLKSRPFLAGDTFSVADITAFAGLMFADAAGIVMPGGYDALKLWRAKVSELPSVKNRGGQTFIPEDLRRLGF